MTNLGALVDKVFHPEIEYFDEEHLMVGFFTGLMTMILFGGLAFYARSLEKALAKYKKAKLARQQSDDKYRHLFETSKDIIFISSPSGRFLDINPAGAELLGYSSVDELKKINLAQDLYYSPVDREKYKKQIESQGYLKDCEIIMRKKSGEKVIVSVSAEVVRDKDGTVTSYWGMMRDITRQKDMEKQLLQTQRMESVGNMAGGIAHDFNNNLTTIRGYEEMAMAEAPAGSVLRDYLDEIRTAADQASDLTGQLLMFSQYHPVDMMPMDVNKLVANLVGRIDQIAGEGVTVSTDLIEGMSIVKGNGQNIEQTIINMVKNAKTAMPDGGHILVKTENVKIDHANASEHPGSYPGEFCCVSVTDTGIGMDDETRERIFEPFFTTSVEIGRSAGLGLSVAYGVVTQHDGWVDVTSSPGEGSTFQLFFPMSSEKVLPETVSVESEDLRGHGEKILLVEDDEAVRKLTERMLEQNGYVVMGAGDANTAFDVFAREKGEFELIFSDVALPGENGVKLVEHLHSYKPGLPVLLVSGYTDVIGDWRFVQEKGYRFLQKPYVLPNLLQTLRELLESQN
ncbi:MAG: ATP-binding protein [Thermoleophilia bacterium]